MEKYDLVVIGAGPAGYAATMRALDLDADARVLLVERGKIGGAGVWNGALSSKTMWELSKDITKLGIRDRGYRVNDFALSYKDIVHCINEAVEERTGHLVHQLRLLEQQVSKRFRLVQGFARLQDAHQVHIQLADGTQEVVQAAHIILAMGSRPRYLPGIPIDEKTIVTSDGIHGWDDFPESMVILGAGVVGCEYATIFANFGRTCVHIINKGEQLIPFEDEDIMHVVAQNLEERGVVIHRNSQLQEMKVVDGKVQYTLSLADGTTLTNTVEKALISVGRVTNLEGMGLREIGLDIDARGNFVIEDTQTNLPNIYAIGDLTAEIQLVNVAEMEGRHASERIFGRQRVALSYDNISTIMFLSPEVAGVGINEKQARQMGIPYRIASYSYGYIPRAIAMRNSNGFFKLIVTDDDEMRLLGMRAVGAQASSTIEAAALLIAMKRGIDELANLIHPHPSITEGIQECARMLKGNSIVKPHLFAANIRCSRYVNGQCIDIIPKVATP
ncbi:MAG: NAD(P)/FAD-dependent oxidoreductase [Bacteroidetes bacterium]|jgi:dihydrolipoamide dehydrogenase|nr:NAD(P)/FAD-dependent oxidoreductase [Bacteroidota bacterium]